MTLMPLWNFIIHQSLLVKYEISSSSYNANSSEEKLLELTNLKINSEINGSSNSNNNNMNNNNFSHGHLIDISLVQPDSLAYSSSSRRQGEGLAPRSCKDFIVAIGFVVLGSIAICAGVYSEVKAQTTTVRRFLF